MITLLRREFEVDRPREAAWRHLAAVQAWPSWARHIRRIDLSPGGLGPRCTGIIRLRNGITSRFAMTAYDPPRRWKWSGRFLWLTIDYDHRFDEAGPGRTRLTWVIEGDGFGVTVLGRLFARIYDRNLDRAIPRLVEELGRVGETDA